MKYAPGRLAAGIAALSLVSCSIERRAGNSSETENNVSAIALSIDSLVPAWDRSRLPTTVATLKLDRTNFDFGALDSAGSELDIQTLGGDPIPFSTVYWDKSSGRARLHIRLDAKFLRSDSRLQLTWDNPPARRSAPEIVWAGISDSLRLELTSVLVDDFERGTMLNRLPAAQTWYSSGSDPDRISWLTIGDAGAGRSGKALGIGYSANAFLGQYALMGTALGNRTYNLRSLDSIVFQVRGSGTLYTSLDRWTNGLGYKARAKVPLDSTWKRVRIRPIDFETTIDASGNIGWTAIRDSVTHLTFLVGGTGELWIDDVRLHGVDRDDFR